MMSLNTDIIVKLEKDSTFKEAFNVADLVLMDSQPLIRVCSRQGITVKEKLAGSDLMPRICEYAAGKGYKCFILGGAKGVPDKACLELSARFPGLRIGGYSPEYGFEKNQESLKSVLNLVAAIHPDILFCCLGTPKSEKLLYQNLRNLGISFAFSVGAAVDFVAGNIKRAPVWMQHAGFEWLFRFMQEPKRLFRRYFVDSWALLRIVKQSSVDNENRN